MTSNGTCCCGCGSKEAAFSALAPVLEQYGKTPGSLITILQHAQDLYGYLSTDAIHYIAEYTGIKPRQDLWRGYLLHPVPPESHRQASHLCCARGPPATSTARTASRRRSPRNWGITDGRPAEDGLFTLNNVACLGCCSLAPVMMIRTADGDETYGNLTKAKVRAILQDIRAKEAASK